MDLSLADIIAESIQLMIDLGAMPFILAFAVAGAAAFMYARFLAVSGGGGGDAVASFSDSEWDAEMWDLEVNDPDNYEDVTGIDDPDSYELVDDLGNPIGPGAYENYDPDWVDNSITDFQEAVSELGFGEPVSADVAYEYVMAAKLNVQDAVADYLHDISEPYEDEE